MPEIISLREFARRVGVSLQAVQRGAKPENGRIAALRDATGKITGIDWETQEAAWTENSKAPQRKPHNPGGGRPRNDGAPPAPPAQSKTVAPSPGKPGHGDENDRETDPGRMSLTAIQRARELVKLQIDNETLKKVRGETVDRAQEFSNGAKLAGTIISSLYNIPERISDDLAGMTDPHKIAELLTREINDAVASIRSKYGV